MKKSTISYIVIAALLEVSGIVLRRRWPVLGILLGIAGAVFASIALVVSLKGRNNE